MLLQTDRKLQVLRAESWNCVFVVPADVTACDVKYIFCFLWFFFVKNVKY